MQVLLLRVGLKTDRGRRRRLAFTRLSAARHPCPAMRTSMRTAAGKGLRDMPADLLCGPGSFSMRVRSSGAPIEIFDYPGAGHLFTDASLPAEYDAQATNLLWSRVLPFCAAPPQ